MPFPDFGALLFFWLLKEKLQITVVFVVKMLEKLLYNTQLT